MDKYDNALFVLFFLYVDGVVDNCGVDDFDGVNDADDRDDDGE